MQWREIFWINESGMRHTDMLAIPERKTSTKLLDLGRKQLYVVSMFLTGHGPFKARLKLFNLIDDDICRFRKRHVEIAKHNLCNCPAFAYQRSCIVNHTFMELSYWKNYDIDKLLLYLRNTDLYTTMFETITN